MMRLLLTLILLLQSLTTIEGGDRICCQPSPDADHLHLPSKDEMKALDDIERIPCDSISVETFLERYEEPAKPVILVGCDQNWPAKENWTFQKLAKRFDSGDRWVDYDIQTKEDTIEWRYVVDAMEKNKRFYVFDNLNTTHGKTLDEDYEVPPFFRHDQFQYFSNFPYKEYGRMRWFALGSKNTGTHSHYDPFETDAWNSVVRGMKWWMLFPPAAHIDAGEDEDDDENNDDDDNDEYDDDDDEYDDDDDDDDDYVGCNPKCSDEDLSIIDYFNALWLAPTKDLFDGGIKHVFQKEGETLYVPNRMIHSVMNVEDTIAVTANYGSSRRIPTIWDTLIDNDADPLELERYYCHILNKSQRSQLVDLSYSCDFNDKEYSEDYI